LYGKNKLLPADSGQGGILNRHPEFFAGTKAIKKLQKPEV
jgi:hypothetical protein